MPGYNTHRLFNFCFVLPVTFWIIYILKLPLSIGMAIWLFIGFYVGTCWITPDLDTNSKPTNKNLLWKIIWYPYTMIMPHRSSSHSYIMGFVGRIIYIGIIMGLILLVFVYFDISLPSVPLTELYLIAVPMLLGIGLANAGHIFLDGIVSAIKKII